MHIASGAASSVHHWLYFCESALLDNKYHKINALMDAFAELDDLY